MPLAEFQRAFREAIVSGASEAALPLLVGPGGGPASARLDIYRRHYEVSLVTAVMNRFPATAWLIGSVPLEDAARAYVRVRPPEAPCIAEYGRDFPAFLGARMPHPHVPLRSFAEFDWHLGRLSVGVDAPVVTMAEAATLADELPLASLTLQDATWYGSANGPLDQLMTRYLDGDSQDAIPAGGEVVRLEARGSRGVVRFTRLLPGVFAFRQALQRGVAVETAVTWAVEADPAFEPGPALAALFQEQLVIGILPRTGVTS